jgi:hypothetical protein
MITTASLDRAALADSSSDKVTGLATTVGISDEYTFELVNLDSV